MLKYPRIYFPTVHFFFEFRVDCMLSASFNIFLNMLYVYLYLYLSDILGINIELNHELNPNNDFDFDLGP